MESRRSTSFERQHLVRAAPAILVLLALAFPLVNPIGYVGGGLDDTHYLEAARCWASSAGSCLPHTHWASRWPAIAPLALVTGMLGEGRWTVGLAPWLAWASCVLLLAAIGRAWFDRATAGLAAALFASTPVVAGAALQPGVDTTELALQLAALWLATQAWSRQSKWIAIAAGASAALAVQARDTSLLFCGAAALAWFLLDTDQRKILLWALPGFVALMLAEPLAYAVLTGDPFYRYRLSLAHVAIPSAELAPSVDTGESPFFNPDYIAGWRRDAGITLWWPIDPWLNLLASPRSGLILSAAVLLIPFGWRYLPTGWSSKVRRMILLALLIAAGLIYALAIDPKPRMMLLLIASASLAASASALACWRAGKGLVPAAVAALVIGGGLYFLSAMAGTREFEQRAAQWIAARPGAVEIEDKSRSVLELVPEARALPDSGSGRRYVIAATNGDCSVFGLRVADSVGPPGGSLLCLLDRRRADRP